MRKTCEKCGCELYCPKCTGKQGIKKAKKEYGLKFFREAGKKGGRPRKAATGTESGAKTQEISTIPVTNVTNKPIDK